ncbi:MAG TPA: DUF1493 family protein [Caulobacteraceae bacterium]|nr:DUF1493 family protein [Caulobacteraceae bacterium]
MTDDEKLECIRAKLADVADIDLAEVIPSTRLYQDAGLSGDDYYDFIVWFSHQFCVRLDGFDLSEFAPPESGNWPFERSKYRELDVRSLVELAQCGSWKESGLEHRLPVT